MILVTQHPYTIVNKTTIEIHQFPPYPI